MVNVTLDIRCFAILADMDRDGMRSCYAFMFECAVCNDLLCINYFVLSLMIN